MRSVSFFASDNYRINGYLYKSNTKLRGRIIVAGATGVPQQFYRRFAEYASLQGFETLTFDYRGIGESSPESLKGFKMNLLDWGRLDLSAAVDYFSQEDTPLFVVGHSYGGHAFGLSTNHQKVKGFYVFGTGAGWHGYMPLLEQVKVKLMWNVVLPMITWWYGYCAWKLLGMGENLPKDVFKQWRYWCRFKHYFFDDPKMPDIGKQFANVHTSMVAANALDDRWALPASRDAFVKHYTHASLTRLDLDPKLLGGEIGHMGYFRKHATPLWQSCLDWFSQIKEQDYAK